MSLFKCKMCGGTLEIAQGMTVAECEYCGTRQTLPKLADDRRVNLYDRANHFRRNNDFDKAMGMYENILSEDNTDAEAYWSIVLCRYGIEYVEDPATRKRIPTVNRAQFTSIFDDEDYKSAVANADSLQKRLYEEEAKAINELQKGILAISQQEAPFDVFVCYKESDKDGRRTPDSVLAQELYYQLCNEGFKVFFSRITLEDKLGSAYEPYIFAALNSAKVMVVLGTRPEYLKAVWVRNEWSRYLALIKNGAKKTLIPAYKDMDPYDLPEEFSHLQALDMSKLGFMQDLVRGIRKIVGAEESKAETVIKETVTTVATAVNISPLLKRAFMFLEDGEWDRADEFCEQVLNQDPECAEAYLGKLMAELHTKTRERLTQCRDPFHGKNNYQKALRFGDEALKAELTGYIEHINTRNENARLEGIYTHAKDIMEKATAEANFKHAAEMFASIRQYKDADALSKECYEKAEIARLDATYDFAKSILSRARTEMDFKQAAEMFASIRQYKDADALSGEAEEKRKDVIYAGATQCMGWERVEAYQRAARILQTIPDWRDSAEKIKLCESKIKELEEKAVAAQQKAAERAKRKKKIAIITTPIVCVIIAFIIVLNTVIIPNGKYNDAIALMDAGKYTEAAMIFSELGDYKDSQDKAKECLAPLFHRVSIATGVCYTVGLRADGTVVAVGENGDGQCNVSDWKDIVSIATGYYHTVGLRADGTVVAVGTNGVGQCNVSDWKGIVSIATGYHHTVGLRADGTVVAVGENYDGQCNVSDWKDIVAIAAGGFYTVGLRSDGTVVAVGMNSYGQCDVSGWKGIVAIEAVSRHTVGLRSDGTVVAVGSNDDGQCNVSDWKDIVAIAAGLNHTVGLRADGTVVAVGNNYNGQCGVSKWKGIRLPE